MHTGNDAGSVFVWHVPGILALLHKEGILCIICTVACPDAIKWVTSSSHIVVCTATHLLQMLSHMLQSCWHSLPFFALCFVFQGSARNVYDSSGQVPLGAAFLPPLPTPGFMLF